MTDRPILFSAPMVRALLDGTKTQTRRVLKPQPYGDVIHYGWQAEGGAFWTDQSFESRRLRIWAGDRLWVREAFSYEALDVDRDRFMEPWYWADGNPPHGDFTKPKPSIHMPRLYSRLTLIVTDVRVERLQDISEADAIAEGVEVSERAFDYDVGEVRRAWFTVPGLDDPGTGISAVDMYSQLWNTINGPGSWAANPWVAAYSFRVTPQNIDTLPPSRAA